MSSSSSDHFHTWYLGCKYRSFRYWHDFTGLLFHLMYKGWRCFSKGFWGLWVLKFLPYKVTGLNSTRASQQAWMPVSPGQGIWAPINPRYPFRCISSLSTLDLSAARSSDVGTAGLILTKLKANCASNLHNS